MTSNTEYFKVGTIVNTHGVKGEVRVITSTDFADDRFKVGNELMVQHKNGKREKQKIVTSRKHKQFQLLSFEGIQSKDEAETLREAGLEIHESERSELSEGDFYYNEIVGLQVYTLEGELLGTVREILSPGANDVWVVQRTEHKKKDLLLPYIEQVVKNIDLDKNCVHVQLMEGLLDE